VACCENLKTTGFRYGQREDIKESSNAVLTGAPLGLAGAKTRLQASALNNQLAQKPGRAIEPMSWPDGVKAMPIWLSLVGDLKPVCRNTAALPSAQMADAETA
jgi:hypothetical protein